MFIDRMSVHMDMDCTEIISMTIDNWVSELEITNFMYAAFTVKINECFGLECKVTKKYKI